MGCHGLAPWSFHVSGYTTLPQTRWDATGSPRGVFMLAATPPYPKRDGMPRARPVEFSCWRLHHLTPNEMGCHGLAPWRFHVGGYTTLPQTRWDATALCRGVSCSKLVSGERETPRDKPVASSSEFKGRG